jgi:hypothetical protein
MRWNDGDGVADSLMDVNPSPVCAAQIVASAPP